ncbi:MAG: hypothetical protein ACYS0H_25280 [Planctomycetota bacterium]|jgi:hypothetical protein
MVRNRQIRGAIVAVAAAFLAVLAAAEAGSNGTSYSSATKRQTAYDILRKAKREPQQAAKTRQDAEIGPVVAKVRLRLAPITRNRSLGYFARKQHGTTAAGPQVFHAGNRRQKSPRDSLSLHGSRRESQAPHRCRRRRLAVEREGIRRHLADHVPDPKSL